MEKESKTSCTEQSREEVAWEQRRKDIIREVLCIFANNDCTVGEACYFLDELRQLLPQISKVNVAWPLTAD